MNITAEAKRIHDEATVVIAHLHMRRRYQLGGIEYDRVGEDLPDCQVDIPKLRRGGVNVIWLSEGGPGEFAVDAEAMMRGIIEPNGRPAVRTAFHGSSEAHRMLRGWDAMHRLFRNFSDDLELATSVGQAQGINERGKIAVFIHTESLLIANDLAVLRTYHSLGLRCSGLVHGAPLDWVDNDLEQRDPSGLTDFGRQVVREMNALGIVIDVSHASEQAVRDVLQESKQPIVASHSNVKQLCPVQRNLTDDQIKGIADRGGVVGIHASSGFVDIDCLHGRKHVQGAQYGASRLEMIGKVKVPGAIDPFTYEIEMRNQSAPPAEMEPFFPRVHLKRLIDHVDYLVNLAGVDHVGIGTDFQFLADAVLDFDDVAKTPNVTQALLDRGYSAQAIKKILGENFLRVMQQVIGE